MTGLSFTHLAAPRRGYRLIIFDYDGTLFDTRPAIIQCIGRAFERHGRSIPAGDAVAGAVNTGATLSNTFLLLDPSLRSDWRALDELVVTYRGVYRDEGAELQRAYPGVAETLQNLHLSGITCAVVSNKGIDAILRSFDQTGLSPLIDFVVGDQPGTPKKPDPAVITDLIAPRYALPRDEMLIVGDTELDILFAKQTGIASCWASYGYGAPAFCRTLKPDYEITFIGHLREIVAAGDPIRSHYDAAKRGVHNT